ncbi:MAG: hypothetical protein E7294_02515 [Lachnospiraceae bacterium]|jgi:HD-GYP domain-containing protein (c-di-GMP phosphodiesterase class II)|nr:hypothetical protein [Lachnospiraceae bacterium]
MEYENYIKRMEKIRRLSTPALDSINDADGYSRLLCDSFNRIGELAAANREFLDSSLYPVLRSDSITDSELASLICFADDLICAERAESIDLPIAYMVSDSLVSDAVDHKDLYEQIRRYDTQTGVVYELMNVTKRIRAYPEITGRYRRIGFKLGDFFWALLKKETFGKISDPQLKQIILTNARYSIAFFEDITNDPEMNALQLSRLQRMYDICSDPFYQTLLEGYDWDYHRFRTLQYYQMALDNNNTAGFNEEQINVIYRKGRELREFWSEKQDYLTRMIGIEEDTPCIDALVYRSEYLNGSITKEEYQTRVLAIYEKRDRSSYATGKIYANLQIPVDLLHSVDPDHVTEHEKDMLYDIYKDVIGYAFRMPNGSGLSSMLEYFYEIIDGFVEIPSRMTFEEAVLQCMAAMHPPTYAHSQMVGQLTECLCSHMIRLMPELLVGVCDTKSAGDVRERRGDILHYAYHAALCHDFGKISIIDTVFMYGRRLLDMEFELIRTHPKSGCELMSRFSSTRPYAEVALGHHKWYDNSGGYPADFDTGKSKVKPIIDIVFCADCLDAATDIIGRSYQKGKQLSDFISELKEGSGTRYAPWLFELFQDRAVYEDITYLLKNGRQKNYRDMYYMLREMHER